MVKLLLFIYELEPVIDNPPTETSDFNVFDILVQGYNLVSQFFGNAIDSVSGAFSVLSESIQTLEVYVTLLPDFMKVGIVALIGFAIFRFQYAYSKGSGQ